MKRFLQAQKHVKSASRGSLNGPCLLRLEIRFAILSEGFVEIAQKKETRQDLE